MGSFGQRGECPECGRIIGTNAGVLARHKDVEGDEEWCAGGGGAPKGDEPSPEARMRASHEAWDRRQREMKERGF